MRIHHVKIHNYRSIREIEFTVREMMVFLGPNNHGKSNILSAIEFGLTASAKLDKSDFFVFRLPGDDEIWVELTFVELTPQESTTFSKYVRADGSLRIKKEARLDQSENVEVAYHGYVQEPQEWWLKEGAFERLSTKDKIKAESGSVVQLQPLLSLTGKITKQAIQDFQRNYIDQNYSSLQFSEILESGPLLGVKNVAGGTLPDFYLVPAVRDLSEEMKIKATTTFGRLLQRAVSEMTELDTRFVELKNKLTDLINELNLRPESGENESRLARLERHIEDELKDWGVKVQIEVAPPEIEKVFELGTQLKLDDGIITDASSKGHGLQRAVLFALLRSWARALRPTESGQTTSPRRASESIIFAIEEPELFLHPHAQRQLAKSLQDISATPQHQVFICSHSTHFVNLDRYRSIAVITKANCAEGTTVKQCNEDLFEGPDSADKKDRFHMAAWVNPDRGEIFFARKVVLVEGETEKSTLPFLAERLRCFDPSVSIVDCGSKYNLPLYIKILNAFKLKYVVIHDEDPLPDPVPAEWNQDKRREKTRLFEKNAEIVDLIVSDYGSLRVFSPVFEQVAGISISQADRKGKALAALDYFAIKTDEDIPGEIKQAVLEAFT